MSKKINEVEQNLISKQCTQTANLIRTLQINEKQKLQLTIEQQLAKRKNNLENEEGEYDADFELLIKAHNQKMNSVVEQINDALEGSTFIM